MENIRVVVPDRPGLLAELTGVLAVRNINVDQIVVESQGNCAVIRMSVEQEDEALKVLTDAGYDAVTDDVLLARIEDRPGALAQLSRVLGEASLNIRSMHHVRREGGQAVVAISTDDNQRARTLIGEAAV